jgi:hypothetical protein
MFSDPLTDAAQQQGCEPGGLLQCVNLRSGESAKGQNQSATLLPQRLLSPAADKGYLAAMPEMGPVMAVVTRRAKQR